MSEVNLTVVDNRYGRAGLFALMSPIYGIASIGDLFIVNSIEFWTGTNPVSGRSPAIVDMPVETIFRVNPHLDPSLTESPNLTLPNLQTQVEPVRHIEMHYLSEYEAQMRVEFSDGSEQILLGRKQAEQVIFILDGVEVTRASTEQLAVFAARG
ncbi:DUF3332 domain-containing protein [Ferrimonas pelagia]|uniref:DUF3332 domain-containing protein n=1 Tax=Ferrimonas pelagia TaxID=1177826 RepID=A0ABP9ESJ0_9GAMM